ncbi:hypothetical protein CFK41_00235 [Brachybacterium ginsengisoli]|uniref:HTH lysR-type domain-containing protein n=1 Tax=Brachybacterium ginsengisoli TaxID=1331682 RepID=A0A291GTC7_9MICO|nr:LysR family transcriptional regulator [Brachybacterium ginsengisoli]ATG53376.1 hypothetical protein CFK41_00235 [Brachybacterium ginsengisoli]
MASTGPSLAQVEALIAVIDHGSFTAAAEVLQISQPSLSRRIHALEETLGARLFLPVGRRMELTETGRGVVAAGRRALAEMGSIDAMVGAARSLTAGSLRLTGLPSLIATELPGHLGRFHRAHPGIRVEVFTVDDAEELVEAIRVGRADAALGVIDRVPGDLAAIPLPAQEFAAVLPAAARGAGDEGPLTSQDVTDRSLITLPRGTSIRQLTDTALRGLGALPAHRITTTQRDSLVPLALAAEGLTVVPTALARTAPAYGGIAVALDPPVHRSLGIIHRPDELPNPALHEFLALIEQAPSA